MIPQSKRPLGKSELREQAEAVFRGTANAADEDLANLSPDEVRRLLHELRVHQIELEMQNEELRCTQGELEAARMRYFDLYNLAQVGYCSLSEKSLILQSNLCAATLLGVARRDLVKRPITRHILKADQDIYYLLRKRLIETGQPQNCELRMTRSDGTQFWAQFTATTTQDDDAAPVFRIVISDITERKEAQATQREHTEQLRTLSRRVLEVQETERRRVANELHDELGQSLTAIKINLQAQQHFRDEPPEKLNVENIRIVEDALLQVRRLALALRPSILDDLGLVPALRWLAEQTEARSGLEVRFQQAVEQGRFANDIETACFRIVQEALTNIIRHAEAQHVDIDLRQDADVMVLTVRDDGRGFDPAARRASAVAGNSVGLLGMQERAMLIGAQLDIRSRPGQGTTVQQRFPCAPLRNN
jgi:PAS domain S-box-containing protein